MEGDKVAPLASKPAKFSVYQNPAFTAALTVKSLYPSRSTFFCIFSVSAASAVAFFAVISRGDTFSYDFRLFHVSSTAAYLLTKALQVIAGVVFFATVCALIRAFSLRKTSIDALLSEFSSKGTSQLTLRQKGLLGFKPQQNRAPETQNGKKTTKVQSEPLVPVHHHPSPASGRVGTDRKKLNASGGNPAASYTPSKSPAGSGSSLSLVNASPSQPFDPSGSLPWSKHQRSTPRKEITTEAMLVEFLAEVDEKIAESSAKVGSSDHVQITPPPTVRSFGIATPGSAATSAPGSGTTRSTPLRPVRMSPASQKFTTPPKKGEGELPAPMSMEQTIQAFENFGIYPHIEHWRDRLRQWFSSVVLNPLVEKIETSHIQVVQAAAKVGFSITVNQVGSDPVNSKVSPGVSAIDGTKDWQPTFILDEDGLLHQLRATLLQARDGLGSPLPSSFVQNPLQNPLLPVIQECLDAITEHQRLHALMKGEWVKGLLPHGSVHAEYTVQRIQELAEGTCLKNYEYLGNGEVYDKKKKKWTLELPTDSHLLLYLFCAFLEHPKWMLHVDSTSYASAQSSKNPLFLGILPPKERFPEKYVAIISSAPSVLHPGACVLAIGKQKPPVFALYWDKKLQFSLQGRTALWDAILLLCYRIKVSYGGVLRGLHLGSSALSILPVLHTETED
ncbi:hypothetical protein H6P81_002052 [Aristolochia fimbriata]|uniref:Cytochrome B561-related protein n=1 Tax=Aristolochia fimbriata TaxID=158543 RepID=A0AAV7F994_ARIFI|nr:hypothetical protein H6P81_002052 [Aristolochia fimbriata]